MELRVDLRRVGSGGMVFLAERGAPLEKGEGDGCMRDHAEGVGVGRKWLVWL